MAVEALTPEQLSDLREQVRMGKRLPPELSQRVVETLRNKRISSAAVQKAGKTSTRKKKGMTEDELDADINSFIRRAVASKPSDNGDGAGSDDEAAGTDEV